MGSFGYDHNGWVAYAQWVNGMPRPVELFTGVWKVPPAPAVWSGQTIFLFIGLQNAAFILQPVLQWGRSFAGGGDYWSIACWCTNGVTGETMVSGCVRVSEGMELRGGVELIGQEGRRFCYRVFVGLAREGGLLNFSGVKVDLDLVVEDMKECLYAFVVLETAGVTGAGELPGAVVFRDLRVKVGGVIVDVGWNARGGALVERADRVRLG